MSAPDPYPTTRRQRRAARRAATSSTPAGGALLQEPRRSPSAGVASRVKDRLSVRRHLILAAKSPLVPIAIGVAVGVVLVALAAGYALGAMRGHDDRGESTVTTIAWGALIGLGIGIVLFGLPGGWWQ